MKKLTAEQAQWLLIAIDTRMQDYDRLNEKCAVIADQVIEIINECTENSNEPQTVDLNAMALDVIKTKESLQRLWGYFHESTVGAYR